MQGALRPLKIGEQLDQTITIYRSSFGDLVRASAAILVPVGIASAIVSVATLPSSGDPLPEGTLTRPGTASLDGGELLLFLFGTGLSLLISLVGSQIATAATIRLVRSTYLDEPPDWRASLAVARDRLPSLVWIAILSGVLTGLGFLACIIPGIYLFGAWAVAVPVLVLEGHRGMNALRRSRDLVRDRWWPTFGAIALVAVILAIAQGILVGTLLAIVSLSGSGAVDVLAQGLTSVASSVLIGPISTTLLVVVYVDLRVRKEDFTLEEFAGALE